MRMLFIWGLAAAKLVAAAARSMALSVLLLA
jgi:hypothetical protein